MRLLSIVLALFLCVPAFASKKLAPLPDAVYSAKTVYIANQTGMQAVADEAYDSLSKWGRFTVVTDKTKADLIVTFALSGRLVEGTSRRALILVVQSPGNDDPIFEATERTTVFGSWTNNCIQDFKKRLESH